MEREVAGAVAAESLDVLRVAREGTVGHHLDLREEVRQSPCEGRLGGAPPSPDQDAPDLGGNGVQKQCKLDLILPDDRGEWKNALLPVKASPLLHAEDGIFSAVFQRYLNI